METKSFSLAAILSLTTGRALCNFGDIHELAEFVAGHSIWTHEFADKDRRESLKDAVLSQHPQLATADGSGVTPENYKEMLAKWEQEFGATLTIAKGNQVRKESPLESMERIAPGVPIVTVVSGK